MVMPLLPTIGKYCVLLGVVLLVLGIAFLFWDRLPGIRHLGRLPGDIFIKKGAFRFYFPMVTCFLVSVVLSLVFWLFKHR